MEPESITYVATAWVEDVYWMIDQILYAGPSLLDARCKLETDLTCTRDAGLIMRCHRWELQTWQHGTIISTERINDI